MVKAPSDDVQTLFGMASLSWNPRQTNLALISEPFDVSFSLYTHLVGTLPVSNQKPVQKSYCFASSVCLPTRQCLHFDHREQQWGLASWITILPFTLFWKHVIKIQPESFTFFKSYIDNMLIFPGFTSFPHNFYPLPLMSSPSVAV